MTEAAVRAHSGWSFALTAVLVREIVLAFALSEAGASA